MSASPSPLEETQKGVLGPKAIPQALWRWGSGGLRVGTKPSETRLVWRKTAEAMVEDIRTRVSRVSRREGVPRDRATRARKPAAERSSKTDLAPGIRVSFPK